MARYFIELAYNGTEYHGWQLQPNARSVQAVVNAALSTCLRQPVETLGCGRTDTGVHARVFYAHFNVAESIADTKAAAASVNALLPKDIAAYRIINVADDAHARFDATGRTYEYHIHFKKSPFLNNLSWLHTPALDTGAMQRAAHRLMAYTDFSAYSKSHTQTFTNNCRISRVHLRADENGLVFTISADRFLRNMVRAIMGTLIMVGQGRINEKEVDKITEGKNRCAAGQSVPACGLYLTEVTYPYIKI